MLQTCWILVFLKSLIVNVVLLSKFRMTCCHRNEIQKPFPVSTRKVLHVSCEAFRSGFWESGTPCDLVSTELLIRHQNNSNIYLLKKEGRKTPSPIWLSDVSYFSFSEITYFCGRTTVLDILYGILLYSALTNHSHPLIFIYICIAHIKLQTLCASGIVYNWPTHNAYI